MKKVEFIYLSQEDVIGVGLTMRDAVSIVEDVFKEHGLGRVENPPKPGIHPQQNAFIHAMPGYLSQEKAAGLKWVSRFSSNAEHNLPAVMGLLVLNDVRTGQPLAVMDCRWITAVRTGAASAVAAKFQEQWVKEGALVLPVHHRGWENQMLHKADKFVTDDWQQLQQAHKEVGGFYGPLPDLYAELGEIVLSKKLGREDDRERIIDFNYGLAVEDVAIAVEILAVAKEKGWGTILPLMERDLPFS